MAEVPPPKRGRGHPPVEYQWKPGESGNDKGRPRKSAQKPDATDTHSVLARITRTLVPTEIGGIRREIPYKDALLHKLAVDSLNDARLGFRMLQFILASEAAMPIPAEPASEPAVELLDDPVVKRMLERELRKRLRRQGQGEAADELMRKQFGTAAPREGEDTPDRSGPGEGEDA